MSDAKRYKAALVSQYSDVVLAIDHEAALAAKDSRIAELERALSLTSGAYRKCIGEAAATPSEDGGEVPEIVGKFCWMDEDMGDGYYVQCVHDLPEHIIDNERELMTVAQHSRIMAAKEAEIARARSVADKLAAERAQLLAQPARQVGGDERCATCDGTGDVHSPGGEWKGRCHCQPIRQVLLNNTWIEATDLLITLLADEYPTRNVYLAPQASLAPAAVAVVMPERKSETAPPPFERGYNAALDAVARLNRRAIPVGLLERCLEQMESDWLQIDGEWGPTKGGLEGAVANGDAEEIRELRALLSKQQGGGV